MMTFVLRYFHLEVAIKPQIGLVGLSCETVQIYGSSALET